MVRAAGLESGGPVLAGDATGGVLGASPVVPGQRDGVGADQVPEVPHHGGRAFARSQGVCVRVSVWVRVRLSVCLSVCLPSSLFMWVSGCVCICLCVERLKDVWVVVVGREGLWS